MQRIRQARRIEEVSYSVFFEWKEHHGSGYSFDCDEKGNVDTSKLQPAGLDSWTYANEHEGKLFYTRSVQRSVHSYFDSGSIRCACGREHQLARGDSRCECGRYYNAVGQELNPPHMWEEN